MIEKNFDSFLKGYAAFKEKYAKGEASEMNRLAQEGQKPTALVISCCDSRVDPALILGASPGELFVVRNVANIVPPYEQNQGHHGTSAALEFAVCFLKVQHIIIWGHSSCGGIEALMRATKEGRFPSAPSFREENGFVAGHTEHRFVKEGSEVPDTAFYEKNNEGAQKSVCRSNDGHQSFIGPWVDIVRPAVQNATHVDQAAQNALHLSYHNALQFPFVKTRVGMGQLTVHRWFFDIKKAELLVYEEKKSMYSSINA